VPQDGSFVPSDNLVRGLEPRLHGLGTSRTPIDPANTAFMASSPVCSPELGTLTLTRH
jgi:hypothetical protein